MATTERKMKDHEIAGLVSDLAAIAREFGQTQQLRERISHRVAAALAAPPVEQQAATWCSACGCGNDVCGYAHLRGCLRAATPSAPAPQAGAAWCVALAPSRKGRVYLAGPMTGYAEYNFPAFNAAAAELRAAGIQVVNPADHGIVVGAEWADYLRFDIAKIAVCESIALLPGWSKSRGARLEVHVAQALGMPVQFLDGAEQAVPSEPSQDAEDAARYRHLRNKSEPNREGDKPWCTVRDNKGYAWAFGSALDATVDAARAAQAQAQGESAGGTPHG